MVRTIAIPIILFFLGAPSYAADCGQFKVVKGKVTFKQKGKSKFRKARINKKVCQGDSVKTESDSRAKIVMADQNEINISPETELLIEVYQKDQKAVLNVLNGKVRSNVKKKYEDDENSHYRVKTKSAVAGVRGTEFLASFSKATNESKVVTFEGVVRVGRLQGGKVIGKVLVRPGQFTSNRPGQNPHSAKTVPVQELAQMDQESNVLESPRGIASEPGTDRSPDSVDSNDDKGSDTEIEPEVEPEAGPGPDAKKDQGNNRQPSSTTGSNELPPPELPDNFAGPTTGPAPPKFDFLPPPPIIDNVCQTCNDAIINQKVKVIIVPKLPGQ